VNALPADSSAAPIVRFDGVSKRYRGRLAVRDVSLAVQPGEILGLLGPNGSGKTTLMRILTGYLSPTSGRASVAGHDTAHEPMAARRHIGYVPENAPLYSHMRVSEFLHFMARLRGVAPAAVAAAVERVATRLRVTDVFRATIGTLSRGYRQRVAIAQALLHDPAVLVLDEPTNGLDPRQIIDTRMLIAGMAGERTIIMSSHILSEVEKTAQRVAILLEGRLLTVRAMADTPDLEALFLSLT
jgi:ABC-2 type transport system ATP-binding protein